MNEALKVNLTCLIIILVTVFMAAIDKTDAKQNRFKDFVGIVFLAASTCWVVSAFFIIWGM